MRVSGVLATFAALLLCGVPRASAQNLILGDDAPALPKLTWLQGEPVRSYEPGRVVVLEFWATWCKPCERSMPHLSALQRQYAAQGLDIVGISREDDAVVRAWLASHATSIEISYALALDRDDTAWSRFMDSAGRGGIPTAFVIGPKGRILWIGHPDGLAGIMPSIFDGTFDPYVVHAWQRQHDDLESALVQAARGQNWPSALDILDALEQLHQQRPEIAGSSSRHDMERLHILLARGIDVPRAGSLANALVLKHWDDAMFLNNLAWYLVDEPGLPVRDLDVAFSATQRSNDLSQHEDAAHLDTLARVLYERGDLAGALQWQAHALSTMARLGSPDWALVAAWARYQTAQAVRHAATKASGVLEAIDASQDTSHADATTP